MLILSINHCSNRLALSLAESKQNMAKIAFCPAYLAADPALITLAIISFTASICLGGGGSRDDGRDNGGDDAGNDAGKEDSREAGGEGGGAPDEGRGNSCGGGGSSGSGDGCSCG